MSLVESSSLISHRLGVRWALLDSGVLKLWLEKSIGAPVTEFAWTGRAMSFINESGDQRQGKSFVKLEYRSKKRPEERGQVRVSV